MSEAIKEQNKESAGTMTVAGHLAELRKRLFISVGALLGMAVLAFAFIQKFVDMMLRLSEGFNFVYLTPSELVMSYLKLSIVLGLVFALPIILWQLWQFVAPGLEGNERRSALTAVLAGFVFFLIGALFCYFIVLPMTLQFFYNFNGSKDITASISFDSYMNFVLSMLLVFGVIFEMPVLCFLLSRLGFLKAEWLKAGRKFAILIIFILAAIITPPDVVSQVMTAFPMIALYELSIIVCQKAAKSDGEVGAA